MVPGAGRRTKAGGIESRFDVPQASIEKPELAFSAGVRASFLDRRRTAQCITRWGEQISKSRLIPFHRQLALVAHHRQPRTVPEQQPQSAPFELRASSRPIFAVLSSPASSRKRRSIFTMLIKGGGTAFVHMQCHHSSESSHQRCWHRSFGPLPAALARAGHLWSAPSATGRPFHCKHRQRSAGDRCIFRLFRQMPLVQPNDSRCCSGR